MADFDQLNPFFDSMYILTNLGRRLYHGLVFGATKRFSQGWQLSASYTYNNGKDNYVNSTDNLTFPVEPTPLIPASIGDGTISPMFSMFTASGNFRFLEGNPAGDRHLRWLATQYDLEFTEWRILYSNFI